MEDIEKAKKSEKREENKGGGVGRKSPTLTKVTKLRDHPHPANWVPLANEASSRKGSTGLVLP